jgi:hypothetical protein
LFNVTPAHLPTFYIPSAITEDDDQASTRTHIHIAGFLHDDRAALSTCSLCCSVALTIAGKPLLFHTIRTGPESNAAA